MKHSWSDGYVTDIEYTYGFYRELTPTLLAYATAEGNLKPPQCGAPLTYCELACGQGLSTNILAAANPQMSFYANDFNPHHIAEAGSLASAAGLTNVRFYDHSFAEFSDEPSLPVQFDIISLHGIYAWISPENRNHILDFIRKKLKPGGLVYVSYNAMPGWSANLPIRKLIHSVGQAASGTTTQKAEAAIAFVERVVGAQSLYFAVTPAARTRVEKLGQQNKHYIAHEYFNEHSTPFYFDELVSELDRAKLGFVGSVNLLERMDWINLRAEQAALIAEVANPVQKELLRDFMINQQFRRDIFSRGSVRLSESQIREATLDTRFVLSIQESEFSYKVQGALGEAVLHQDVYGPIVKTLGTGAKTVRQVLAENNEIAALGWGKLRQALAVLVGMGHVQPCLPAKDEQRRTQSTKAFNAAVVKLSEVHGNVSFLASPVTGGGIYVDRISQLFLHVRSAKAADVSLTVWELLKRQGQSLMKDGVAIEGETANLEHLRTTYELFLSAKLPVYSRLGLV
ncbi:AdoMet_MTases domain containing protein [Rhabdaerophilaceae bacterium]